MAVVSACEQDKGNNNTWTYSTDAATVTKSGNTVYCGDWAAPMGTDEEAITMPRTHYIAMSGEYGCMPDNCGAYPTEEDAVQSLIDLFELGRVRAKSLRESLYLDLNPSRDGASYCEVTSCTCDEPWVHDDGMTEAEGKRKWAANTGIAQTKTKKTKTTQKTIPATNAKRR
jgi:hypothetical protein